MMGSIARFVTLWAVLLLSVNSIAQSQQLFPVLVGKAQELPNSGVIQKGKGDFYYVKVSNAFIHELFSYQNLKEFKKPPYFRRKGSPGAHISLMYEYEAKSLQGAMPIGKQIQFKVINDKIVEAGNKYYYVLTVEAPELEAIRMNLGLSKWLNHHAFHITVAVKD